jgi:hypothetical protein
MTDVFFVIKKIDHIFINNQFFYIIEILQLLIVLAAQKYEYPTRQNSLSKVNMTSLLYKNNKMTISRLNRLVLQELIRSVLVSYYNK